MGGQPARSGRYLGNGLLTPHAGLGSDISQLGWRKCSPKRNCYEPGQARNSVLCKWNTLFERTGKPVQRIWFALSTLGF